MPANKKLNGVASLQAAADWLSLGIQPVPLYPHQKKPKGDSWQKISVSEASLEKYFKPGDNVGGLWGKPSNWIVDIDLDDENSAKVAKELMPTTLTFGRQSRPHTHLLYICKGAKTKKWKGPNREMLVELRSTGSQTVLPPSIHPDKERYIVDDWNEEEFTSIPRIRLLNLLDHVAATTLLVRHYPEDGSRHDYVHALTGALLYSKIKIEDVRLLARTVIKCTKDKEDDLQQRYRTVENTIEHYNRGDRVGGWPMLKEWISQREIQMIRRWITHRDHSEDAPETLEAARETRQKSVPDFPSDLLKVPGLVGDLVQWSAKQTYLEQPSFDLATALMCTALATCNHYEVDHWSTPLQPYFMLLAPTAAGKGASLDRVYEFAKQVKLEKTIYQHFQSYHSMMDELSSYPNTVCWLWDEAPRHLRTASSASSQDFQILSHLISLYGRANRHVPGVPGRKNPIPPLDNPFLLLFATAQPSRLVEAISMADLASGFVNRFILFDSGDGVPQRNLGRDSIFPSKILKTAKALVKHEPKGGRTVIRFANTEAFTIFDDFAEECRTKTSTGPANEIWGRANQNALIVAGIAAVGVNPKAPRITPEIAGWALRLVTWSINAWSIRVEDLSSGTFRESHSKKIEMMIRNPQALITNRTRAPQKALLLKGLIPKSVLTGKCRSLNSRDIDDILDQLLAIGLIGTDEREDGTIVYWPK